MIPRPPLSTFFPYTTLFRSFIFISSWNRGIGGKQASCGGSLAPPALHEIGFQAWSSSKADRKSTRLNSSHSSISYAVFGLKKKNSIDVRTRDGSEHTSTHTF